MLINRIFGQKPLTIVKQSSYFLPKRFASKDLKVFYKPNTYERYLLVWFKKYPSFKDVPNTVPQDMMEKVKDWSRIRISIIFCLIAGVVCVGMVYSGKQAASRGESVRKMNERFHEEYNAKHK